MAINTEIILCTTDNAITIKELARIAPEALRAKGVDPIAILAGEDLEMSEEEEANLSMIWVMLEKPELVSIDSEPGYDDEDCRPNYTQTNEPELAEWLIECWDDIVLEFEGQQFVVLCGSYDDEYGEFWDRSAGVWCSYCF